MPLLRLNTDPSRSQLIQFGVAWIVFFGVAASLAAWRGSPASAWAFGVAAIVPPLVGCLVPRFLRLLYVGLSVVTFPIGFVVSHLVLAALYFLVVTPTGVFLRWLRPDFFPRRPDPSLPTYWRSRPETRSPSDYFKPY